jgi:TonB family protein
MFRAIRRHWLATLLLAMLGSTAAAAPGPSASAWAEFDASGRILDWQWHSRSQTLSAAVREAIERQLRALAFRIAAQNPHARRYGTNVSVETWLQEDGDDLLLGIRSVRTGVGYLKLRPPRYPHSGLRRGESVDLLATVEVDADGRAASIKIRSSSTDGEEFRTAAEHAIRSWRFSTEQIDGRPIAGTLNIPIRFSVHCSRGQRGFELDAPAPRPLVNVQDNRAQAEMIEVTASRRMGAVKPCDPARE